MPKHVGTYSDAMVEIYKANGINKVIKWVDNFVFFRSPMDPTGIRSTVLNYSYDESTIQSIAEGLGWPWAPKKCFPFSSTFT